jgi:hypothetical protein
MENFTINKIIDQLVTEDLFDGQRFSNIDLIDIGIRAARSFHTQGYSTHKIKHTLPNGFNSKINVYPSWFRKDVVSIISRYVKARSKGNLITTFEWNKRISKSEL